MKLNDIIVEMVSSDTTLSKVKGPIPVKIQDMEFELLLSRNSAVKGTFNVRLSGAGFNKKVRVMGAASGEATVGETIDRINTVGKGRRPKITLRKDEG